MGDGMKLLMEKFRSQVARKQKTVKTTVSKDELQKNSDLFIKIK